MTLIKIIINWIIRLFKKIFGKKKVTKKIKSNIIDARNKRYLKGYGMLDSEITPKGFPIYLMIDKIEKEKLINKVHLVKDQIYKINSDDKEILYARINEVINKIEDSKISFYQNEMISETIDNFIRDKDLKMPLAKKVDILSQNITEILENFDKNIQDRVEKEYQEVNFITVSTFLLDETIKELERINDDYKHHKYNKYYYEKELDKIKERIKKLKRLRDSAKVSEEIEILRKSLYTKSIDKYDLLYNDEIFLNINRTCDDLIDKVNRKVIDLKKTKSDDKQGQETKKKKEEQKDSLDNIIKRFKDLELARKILLLKRQDDYEIKNIDELLKRMNTIYYDFISGEKAIFNYNRNKTKTELVNFYNEMNQLNFALTKKEYYFVDHINYRMDDLLAAALSKKEEVEGLLEERYHYKREQHEESILVNNKLAILKEKEEQHLTNNHVLVKRRETNNNEKK